MQKILVIGATGFVGSALIIELLREGYAVKAAMRFEKSLTNNAEAIVVGYINGDTDWTNALVDVDVVIHLAARVHVMKEHYTNPLAKFREVNVEGTCQLATSAASSGVKRFVYLSSIKVNGEFTEVNPFTELDLTSPLDPYAISKWEAEKALIIIGKETSMEVVIVRPPLVYGTGVKANFAALLKLVNKKLPLPLASINAKRSLIYVGNLVDAITVCASHPKAAGQTYLVSDDEDVPMPQLIKKIADALNKPSYLLPFPVYFIRLFAKAVGRLSIADRLTQPLVIDCSKIRQELGWKPPFTMDQGLKITAEWYLQSLKKDRS